MAVTEGSLTENLNKTGVRLWTESRPPAGPAQADTNARQRRRDRFGDQQHRRHAGDGAERRRRDDRSLADGSARQRPGAQVSARRDRIGDVRDCGRHAVACRGLERTWADLIGPAATLRSRTAHDAVEGRGIQPLGRSQRGREHQVAQVVERNEKNAADRLDDAHSPGTTATGRSGEACVRRSSGGCCAP